MLTAQGGLTRPRRHPSAVLLVVAGALSLVGHAVCLLWLVDRPGRALPSPAPPLEIEMIQQPAELRGAPPPPASTPTPPDASSNASPNTASPEAPTAAQAPAPAPPTQEAVAAASKPPPPKPPPPKPPPPKPPEVNLGSAFRDVDPLTVTGQNVVPAGPDARYRNLPPHYPAAAAKIGAEGTVQLVVHIAPTGQALSADVLGSSGNADLDEEARRAVMLWRFRPAMEGRQPVPFDYVIDIRFALGDR